ncbi:energy transducer TonB [Sphingobium sp. YR768]|uniref:energy transducer TonB n=1 Tax=Sphingobium sp. YR768 TaxID=1884365 RepID=UPI0008C118D8|nr:energy transducer TonB [Sphingobium sp. YR768]SES11961.1 protein TonB [Sphingobium sp. YR768]
MKPGGYRGTQLPAANDETALFEGHVVFRSYYHDNLTQREITARSPPANPQDDEVSRRHSRYCDQPMDWRTRLFGFAGTASVIGLVLAAGLFTWKAIYQPVRATSKPLTVVDLAPLAAPPEPVKQVAPGPEQIEKQEAKPEPKPDVLVPTPMIHVPSANQAQKRNDPVEVVDPGPPVPETTAPKSIAAPMASRLANDARPNWEGLILAHLERFRRYPARARAARLQGTAYVRFTINRDGVVLSSAIVKKSGSFDLDQAALDTLQRAQPLPTIPEDRPDIVELTIPVEFRIR